MKQNENVQKKYIDAAMCTSLFSSKEIFIFGAGNSATEMYEQLSSEISVVAFIDNNKSGKGNTFHGKDIISLEQCLGIRKQKQPIIIASQLYAKEISKQLDENGLIACEDYFVWDEQHIFCYNQDIQEIISFFEKVWSHERTAAGHNESVILVPFSNVHNTNIVKYAYCANFFAEKYNAKIYAYFRRELSISNASEVVKDIYKACNIEGLVDTTLDESQREEVEEICSNLWRGLYTWEDWNDIAIYGIQFGPNIVSYFLRHNIPCFDLREEKMYAHLKKSVETIVFWYHYMNENDVKAVFLGDGVTREGLIRDIAVSKGIPTYASAESLERLDLNWKGKRAKVFPNFEKMWEQLTPEEQEYGLKWAKKQLEKRLLGGTDEVWASHKNIYTFAEKEKEYRVLEQNDKIKIIICPHIFEEDCLVCGEQIFDNNYFSWLCHLGELSERTPQYDWYLKMHPNAQTRDFIIMDMLLNKYTKIKKIPANISPFQMKKEGADFALTIYGTIGHEFPEIGIQVINAGCNPHMAFDFTWNPTTKEEYDDLLLNLEKLHKEVKEEELYKFYSLYYLFYDWTYTPYQTMFFENPVLSMNSWELKAQGMSAGTWMYREIINEWTQERHEELLAKLQEVFTKVDEWRPDILYKKKIDIKEGQ